MFKLFALIIAATLVLTLAAPKPSGILAPVAYTAPVVAPVAPVAAASVAYTASIAAPVAYSAYAPHVVSYASPIW